MKKQILLLAAAVAVSATAAYGLTIVGTAHDLKGGYGGTALGSNEICIYCHTPHNAAVPIPLWNRTNPSGAGFTLYKTSPTLTSATKASVLVDTSISLFCMSCHDGATALGAITNIGNAVSMDTTKVIPSGNANNLGTNLTNDHPVGFDYDLAATADTTLHPLAQAKTNIGSSPGSNSSPFFASDSIGTGSMMECASCHMVHDNRYTNFLRMNNAGSGLCLACHIK